MNEFDAFLSETVEPERAPSRIFPARPSVPRESAGYQGFSSGRPIDKDVGALTLAERYIVGALLADNDRYTLVSALRPDDFADVVCARIFRVIQDTLEEAVAGKGIMDPVACAAFPEVSRVITPARLRGLVSQVGEISDEVLTSHVALVRRSGARRRVARQLVETQMLVESPTATESQIARSLRLVSEAADASSCGDALMQMGHYSTRALDDLVRELETGESANKLSTPFDAFNAIVPALAPGQVIIIAGRPAMGKTVLALDIAVHVAGTLGKHVQLFSLEMGGDELGRRTLAKESGVPGKRIRDRALTQDDLEALAAANARLQAMPLLIDPTARLNTVTLKAAARRAARMGKVDLIIIDYLQLMENSPGFTGRRQDAITEISREIKLLAGELGIPIIALSQLNRSVEQRPDKRPMMSDLRESGAIEQDADVIIFVYRDEVYNPNTLDQGVAEIIVGKHRDGEVGTARLGFNGPLTRFENLEPL